MAITIDRYQNRLVIQLVLAIFLALSGPVGAGAEAVEKKVPGHFRYHYFHEIPSDYLFRAGLAVSAWEREAEAGSSPAVAGPDTGAAKSFSDQAINDLVTELLAKGGDELRGQQTLVVTTPVNLRNLYATSSFGRLLGERLLGELQRAGMNVVDVRKTPALLISRHHGEFGLSRDMDELPYVLHAQAVLVGTYTATSERVMVDLRVLRNRDGRVVASARRDFDIDREILVLLADEISPPRPAVPVRIRPYE